LNEPSTVPAADTDTDSAGSYRHLPERVPLEDMITEQPASDAPDPEMGRDPNHDWLLRGV
jgi:hypothetical protein